MTQLFASLKSTVFAIVLGAAAVAPCAAQPSPSAADPRAACGSLYTTSYGPFDYRIYRGRHEVNIVEQHHFTPQVEALIKPMFGTRFAPDFDYVLKTIPNHHRALASMVRNSLRLKNPQPDGASWSVDCYFDRAMRFSPEDMVVRMLYADYLLKLGNRVPDAVGMLDGVVPTIGDNAITAYNAGLLYAEAKEFGKAKELAKRALELGLTWPALTERLAAAGQWQPSDAPGAAAPAPASAASAASVPATRKP